MQLKDWTVKVGQSGVYVQTVQQLSVNNNYQHGSITVLFKITDKKTAPGHNRLTCSFNKFNTPKNVLRICCHKC